MRNRFSAWCGLLGLSLLCVLGSCRRSDAQTKLLRFPDLHGDKVVFTYAGDLWTAPAVGGTASRLTAHPGLELFARFSPDGKRLAFTGQYDGDEQVYVMPASGGEPVQLTFYPARGRCPTDGASITRSTAGLLTANRSSSARWRGLVDVPDQALHCPGRRRAAEGPADARLGRRDVLARRDQGALLAADPRFSHVEALSRGMGAGPSHLRPGDLRGRAGGPLASHGARPDVDRREDLLRVRPHRDAQSASSSIPEPRLSSSSRRAPATTSAGRAQATAAGSSTSSVASCTSWTRARARPGRSRSPLPPMPWPGAFKGRGRARP